jgi:hypothetical protein
MDSKYSRNKSLTLGKNYADEGMGHVLKFNEFLMTNRAVLKKDDEDVISYLYSLDNVELNGYVNDFLTQSRTRRKEYIEDILLEIGDIVEPAKFQWVSKELKNF